MTDDDFRLHHSGEIREALIMIEGDSGGFELVKHGMMLTWIAKWRCPTHSFAARTAAAPIFWFVNLPSGEPHWPQWHELSDTEMALYSALA